MTKPMRRYIRVLALVFLPFSLVLTQDVPEQARVDIDRLTSKVFLGRGFPLGGHKIAAGFLKERFKEIGLLPIGEEFGQKFDAEVNIVESTPRLIINGKTLILGSDFLPFATTGSGESSEGNPIFYLRSGLFIPERSINDYASVNQRGSILLVDEEIPSSIQNDKSFNPEFLSRETRIEIARVLKASAVIFLVKKLSYSTPSTRNKIPVFDVLRSNIPNPVKTISFEVESSLEDFEGENIIGKLLGTDLSDSTVIISAHYDHVGCFSDSLYFPGANDNASGVAMMLSLADHFKRNRPKHSIVFIAFSAEEIGLVGSKYYSENPLTPLEKTIFMLNLDMVASGDDGVMAVGGENHTEYFHILKSINDSLKIAPLYKRATAPNSDHWYLSQKGVKTFFLYANKGSQPYHSTQDVPATLDWKAFGHILSLSKAFIGRIAN